MSVAETVSRWQAEENAVLDRHREKGTRQGFLAQDVLHTMSGLEIYRGMVAGDIALTPIFETIGYCPIEFEVGRAVFQGRPRHDHCNPLGIVHGGWFGVLLDQAVGTAIHTALPRGRVPTTLEIKTNIVRPLTTENGPVRAEGKVVHLGSRVVTAEGRLTGPDGKLYAHCSTTCMVVAPPEPGGRING